MDTEAIGASIAGELEALGPVFGFALLFYSGLLMVQGHRHLKHVTAITGVTTGYILTPLVYIILSPIFPALQPMHVLLGMMGLCGVVMMSMINVTIRFMAAVFIYVTFTTGMLFLKGYGVDVENGNILSGIASILAFFLAMEIRRLLPTLVSAILGSYGCIISILLILQKPLSVLNPTNSLTFLLVVPFFIASIFLQQRDLDRMEDKEIDEELEAEDEEEEGY